MLRWAIQSNLVNAADVDKLLDACRQHGRPAVTFETIPFSNQPPALDFDQPTVFYGATGCMSNVWQAGTWSPGVFFDPQRFSFPEWARAYHGHCLNGEAREMTLASLAAEEHQPERLFFLRPIHDDKAFAGEVMAFAEIRNWVGELDQTVLSPDTPILVAEPVGISHEWRLFLVDGKVSTGSHYRSRQRLNVYAGIPDEVIEFAEKLARVWQPAPVFVLDVARSGDQLYVVEINCFNSSGFYASDVAKLVGDVSRYIDGD